MQPLRASANSHFLSIIVFEMDGFLANHVGNNGLHISEDLEAVRLKSWLNFLTLRLIINFRLDS